MLRVYQSQGEIKGVPELAQRILVVSQE